MSEELLNLLFAEAVKAADPMEAVPQYLPPRPNGRTLIVGAGKASAAMAKAVESIWQTDISGLVIVPYGSLLECQSIEIIEARHPIPDDAGVKGSHRMLELVSGLSADDLVLCLISGGGSSLLSAPGPGISLQDKQKLNAALLSSGAAINEMNCVRKHLSAIKGGRLAMAAYPAKVVTLTISDVPGDDPATIASGPTVANNTTATDALDIITRYKIDAPDTIMQLLNSSDATTPTVQTPELSKIETHIICKPQKSLEAAAKAAQAHGYQPIILSDAIQGEAREVGKVLAAITQQVLKFNQPVAAPAAIISGGETTVTLRGKGGRGGRNAEFLLAFALAIGNNKPVHALACDTDGIDGSENNAGAIWTPAVAQEAIRLGLSLTRYLDTNDAYSFFAAVGGLVETGPTHTNVNDFRVILVK